MGQTWGPSSCSFVPRVQGCWRPLTDVELSHGCSWMRLLVLSAHVTPAWWQLWPCEGQIGKTRGSKKRHAIALLCIDSRHALPPCAGREVHDNAQQSSPHPKTSSTFSSQPAQAPSPGCRSQRLLGGCPRQSHLLGTTSLLLTGSQRAGTGAIGLMSLGHNRVLQGKQKEMENKYSIMMIVSGDQGNNCSEQSPLGKGRVSEQSWVAFMHSVIIKRPGHCR